MMFILSFIKISQLAQKLFGGGGDIQGQAVDRTQGTAAVSIHGLSRGTTGCV
jgi:hypothetical protein